MSGKPLKKEQAEQAAKRERAWAEFKRALIEDCVNDLDFNGPYDEDSPEWKRGFILARRVKKSLIDHGVIPEQMKPAFFYDVVVELACEWDIDSDELLSAFESGWRSARLPEGYDTVNYVARIVELSSYRIDVGADWPTPTSAANAAKLATVIEILPQYSDKETFLSCRTAAELIGKGRQHAAWLLSELVRRGVTELTNAADGHDPKKRLAACYRIAREKSGHK